MILILAEKPSVGQAIAKVLGATQRGAGYVHGNCYIVSWCFGHLVELAQPKDYDPALEQWDLRTLPIIPQEFKTVIQASTEKQFKIIQSLMHRTDVKEVIAATDAGREGELIFRLVYEQAMCKKPVKRLWISSLESSAIREGMEHLKPASEYDCLYHAARCRQRADWLLGINLSRLYTIMYSHKLPIGRVQTPTLQLIVSRQAEIEQFVPETYFTLCADLGGFNAYSRVSTAAEAEAAVAACKISDAFAAKIEQSERQDSPPHLYNQDTLQMDANRLYGFTAQDTLSYAQALYEAKLATYPRTDSSYLTKDMEPAVVPLASKLLQSGVLPPDISRQCSLELLDVQSVIDDNKVSDHHAIIPTGGITKKVFDSLSAGEQKILYLLILRFLAALYPPRRYSSTKIVFDISGYAFSSTGIEVIDPGYRFIWDALVAEPSMESGSMEDEPDNDNLPSIAEGSTYPVKGIKAIAKKTRPPRPYTDGTLVQAMRTCGKTLADDDLRDAIKDCGMGTVATRAAIIESIIKSGYVRRSGNFLVPTDDGKLLIELVPTTIKAPSLTAQWEKQLAEIEHNALSEDDFMASIISFLRSFIADAKLLSGSQDSSELFAPKERISLGLCPICGRQVRAYPKSYSCESGKGGCGFTIWKSIAQKSITEAQVKKLLATGRSSLIKGFVSKAGKNFDAYLILKDDHQVGFEFPSRGENEKAGHR